MWAMACSRGSLPHQKGGCVSSLADAQQSSALRGGASRLGCCWGRTVLEVWAHQLVRDSHPVRGPETAQKQAQPDRAPSAGWTSHSQYRAARRGCFGGSACKESACEVGDPGSILVSRRCPGEGNGYPLQHSCLDKNSMDRGASWGSVHGVAKSRTRLADQAHRRSRIRTGRAGKSKSDEEKIAFSL